MAAEKWTYTDLLISPVMLQEGVNDHEGNNIQWVLVKCSEAVWYSITAPHASHAAVPQLHFELWSGKNNHCFLLWPCDLLEIAVLCLTQALSGCSSSCLTWDLHVSMCIRLLHGLWLLPYPGCERPSTSHLTMGWAWKHRLLSLSKTKARLWELCLENIILLSA